MVESRIMELAGKRPLKTVTLRALAIRINRKLMPQGKFIFKAHNIETKPRTFFMRAMGGEYRPNLANDELHVVGVEPVDIVDLADKLGVLAADEHVSEFRRTSADLRPSKGLLRQECG